MSTHDNEFPGEDEYPDRVEDFENATQDLYNWHRQCGDSHAEAMQRMHEDFEKWAKHAEANYSPM